MLFYILSIFLRVFDDVTASETRERLCLSLCINATLYMGYMLVYCVHYLQLFAASSMVFNIGFVPIKVGQHVRIAQKWLAILREMVCTYFHL